MTQSPISHHLSALRNAGLLSVRMKGQWLHYSLRCETLTGVVRAFADELLEKLDSPLKHLIAMQRRLIEMVRTTVRAGVCGFTTQINAESDDMQNVTFKIESDCPNIAKLAEGFPTVDGYEEIGAGFSGTIHQQVVNNLKGCCSGCVVPSGIFKSMQVAAGLALPAPVSIDIEKN